MIPSYGFDRENQGKLINDVKAPISGRTEGGFNVRSPKVRRHSIGYLDNEYADRLRAFVKPTDGGEDSLDKARKQTYTRVPPLATVGMPSFAAATATKARQSFLRWLPSKYTLRRGLQLNLKTDVFPWLKFVLPVLAVAIGLIIAMTASKTQTVHKSAHNQPAASSVSQPAATTNNTSNAPGSSNTSTASGTNASSSGDTSSGGSGGYSSAGTTNGSGSGSNGSSASPQPTGGMGGGSTSSGSGSSSGSSGVTLTTPPISVGGKTILSPITVDP